MTRMPRSTPLVKKVWLKTQTKVVLIAQRMNQTEDHRLNLTQARGEITSITTYLKRQGSWYQNVLSGEMSKITKDFLHEKFGEQLPETSTNDTCDALSEELVRRLFGETEYLPCACPVEKKD